MNWLHDKFGYAMTIPNIIVALDECGIVHPKKDKLRLLITQWETSFTYDSKNTLHEKYKKTGVRNGCLMIPTKVIEEYIVSLNNA